MKTRAVFRSLDQHTGEHRPSRFFQAMTGADEHLAELAGLRVRVEAVRALHPRVVWPNSHHEPHCGECGFNTAWPCPTIKALDGQL